MPGPPSIQSAANLLTGEDPQRQLAADIRRGLTSNPRQIPCKYLYDARGSELFEQICRTPEYYPTRTELSILDRSGADIMNFLGPHGGDLIELGSGSNLKIRTLLRSVGSARLRSLRYVPVDISESCLLQSTRQLSDLHAELRIRSIVADFTCSLEMLAGRRKKMILFLGSTIGNFPEAECTAFLKHAAAVMNPADRLVIGLDMLKAIPILEKAYNDAAGVTAAFNLNLLRRLNRELAADFDIGAFGHAAVFNARDARIEMHLKVNRDSVVNLRRLPLRIHFRRGETIRTEICRKFSRGSAAALFQSAGLAAIRWFTDERGWFSVVVLQKRNRS